LTAFGAAVEGLFAVVARGQVKIEIHQRFALGISRRYIVIRTRARRPVRPSCLDAWRRSEVVMEGIDTEKQSRPVPDDGSPQFGRLRIAAITFGSQAYYS